MAIVGISKRLFPKVRLIKIKPSTLGPLRFGWKFSSDATSWGDVKDLLLKMKSGVHIDNKKGEAEVFIPGLGFEDFTASADGKSYNLKTWRILNHIDHSRERIFNAGYLDYKDLEKSHYTYYSGVTFNCTSPFEVQPLFSKPYSTALSVKTKIGCIGKTSLQLDHKVYADVDGNEKEIFQSSIVWVLVDKETRKPSKPPQWWDDCYRYVACTDEVFPFRLTKLKMPEISFSHDILVGALDMDYYGHANNTAYIRFGMDSIYSALRSNCLPTKGTENVIENKIKKMELLYLQDCKVGDKLKGFVWSTGNDYYCVVKNAEGKDLYHQSLQVHDFNANL